jgi:competence ComEA-like helix-hairpin-helix protein
MRLLCLLMIAVSCWAGDPASGPLPERIDLNNAAPETIEKLPGVGPKLAREIIAGRPYRTIDELDRVKGIGPKKLAQIRPRVFIVPMRGPAPPRPVSSATATRPEPININTATQKELQKLPGVGPKRAEEIIKRRPFKAAEDLMKVPGLKRAQFEKLKDQVRIN